MHVENKGISLDVAVQSHREAVKANVSSICFKLSQLLLLKRNTSTQFQMLTQKLHTQKLKAEKSEQ